MQLNSLNVTSAKQTQFEKKGIYSVEDLVRYLPRKYKDFTKETGLQPDGDTCCFIIQLKSLTSGHGAKVPYLRAFGIELRTGANVNITWFRQNYLEKNLSPYIGMNFYVAGKVTYNQQYGNYSVCSPELFELMRDGVQRIYPDYPKIPGMSTAYLTEKIKAAFSFPSVTAEMIPSDIPTRLGLLSEREALYHLHNPINQTQIDEGRKRIIFDDLLYFALHNEWAQAEAAVESTIVVKQLDCLDKLKKLLPYTLTKDQEDTVNQVLALAAAGKRVNALVQGDVGCGKTVIAMLIMGVIVESGYQAALMAPTQVLARQHYEEMSAMLQPLGIHVVYLGSELKAKEKAKTLREIQDGEADIIIGTHSVISDSVVYKNLGITVTDEEHKFGVAQRAALVRKAAAGVHSVTMSATPIPRTLAQVVYGSTIQLHTIRTMPAGRRPVITGMATTKEKLFRFIIREARNGHQTYVVCPLIDPSDSVEMTGVKSVEEVYQEYSEALTPYGINIAMLSGRNSKRETEEIIEKFRRNEYNVLISTTVVEVGVNIPSATLMVISNAERFGLASLHQLRGRVGRSDQQAYCVLVEEKVTAKSRLRLDTMCQTSDGFKIAEADLQIRGAGDFLGTKQSGDNVFMTLMMAYPELYDQARQIARELLAAPKPCRLVQVVRQEREENQAIA